MNVDRHYYNPAPSQRAELPTADAAKTPTATALKPTERTAPMSDPTPTYYVRHPDGTFSIAKPQPTPEQIAAQAALVYAQCDRRHDGGCCEDPDCYRSQATCQALGLTAGEPTGEVPPPAPKAPPPAQSSSSGPDDRPEPPAEGTTAKPAAAQAQQGQQRGGEWEPTDAERKAIEAEERAAGANPQSAARAPGRRRSSSS